MVHGPPATLLAETVHEIPVGQWISDPVARIEEVKRVPLERWMQQRIRITRISRMGFKLTVTD